MAAILDDAWQIVTIFPTTLGHGLAASDRCGRRISLKK